MKCKFYTLFLLFCLFNLPFSNAQDLTWTQPPFSQKIFIENVGQYKRSLINDSIVFGFESNGAGVYLSRSGHIYYKLQRLEFTESERKDLRGKDLPQARTFLKAEWQNASPSPEIITASRSKDYHTFADPPGKKAYGYDTVRFRNIYPFTDLVIAFPDTNAIKYSLVLRPGADPGRIKLKYSGQDSMRFDAGGILIFSPNGSIKEHAPVSYPETGIGQVIGTRFTLDGSTIGFSLDAFNPLETVVIDPWVTVPVGLTTDLKAFNVDFDKYGNVYVYGGFRPFKVQKYNPAGGLLWTHDLMGTIYSSIGDLAVSNEGTVYTAEGCCAGYREKISPAGALILLPPYDPAFYEFWKLEFNRTRNRLAVAHFDGNKDDLSYVDTTTLAMVALTFVSNNEIRAMSFGSNGNLYALTSDDNRLLARTPAWAPVAFGTAASGYNMIEMGPLYTTYFANGQNSIVADLNFIYTTNGLYLDRRSLATGLVLARTVIPGGVEEGNSGLAVDNCQVYVGSQQAVYRYRLNFANNEAPLGLEATPGTVFDVEVTYDNKILACGEGFLASFDTVAGACNTVVPLKAILLEGFARGGHNVIAFRVSEPGGLRKIIVERAAEGNDFLPVHEIAGPFDASLRRFTDENPPFCIAYYRLRMLERDAETFSEVISISPPEIREGVTAYSPNPLADPDEFTLNLNSSAHRKITLKILNTGLETGSLSLECKPGSSTFRIPSSGFSKGLNFLVFSGEQDFSTLKIIVE
jgi:hypothetical protein